MIKSLYAPSRTKKLLGWDAAYPAREEPVLGADFGASRQECDMIRLLEFLCQVRFRGLLQCNYCDGLEAHRFVIQLMYDRHEQSLERKFFHYKIGMFFILSYTRQVFWTILVDYFDMLLLASSVFATYELSRNTFWARHSFQWYTHTKNTIVQINFLQGRHV